MRRCFFDQVCVARSHIAYVALAGFGNEDWCGQFSTTDAVASETSGGKFLSARPNLPASIFGSCAGVSLLSESPAT
jgi:hypothetical protein